VARVTRSTRFRPQPQKPPSLAGVLLKGVIMSLTVSLVCALILTIVSLVTDLVFIDNYLQYIMVGITMFSIFIGSAYATMRAGGRGLVIGLAVGVIYVLLSLAIGTSLSQETLSLLMIVNKLLAGIGAGILGGLVGANL